MSLLWLVQLGVILQPDSFVGLRDSDDWVTSAECLPSSQTALVECSVLLMLHYPAVMKVGLLISAFFKNVLGLSTFSHYKTPVAVAEQKHTLI